MNRGWITLFRKLTEWEWYHDSRMVHLFVHLLIQANHKDLKWRGKTIKRGQVLTSFRMLSEETGISIQTIRTLIKRLKSTHEITQESTQLNSIITVANYNEYQEKAKNGNTGINTASNKRSTHDQHTTNTATNNNGNNVNNDNKKKKKAEPKKKYGEYKNVKLTDREYQRLLDEWGETTLKAMIKELDEGIQMKRTKYSYSDHNLAIRKWKRNRDNNRTGKTLFDDQKIQDAKIYDEKKPGDSRC
jgi:hypothetical protein